MRTDEQAAVPRRTAARREKTRSRLVGWFQLDATILRATFVGVVRRDEVRLAEATRNQPRFRNTLVFEILRDRIGTTLREFQIVLFAADRVAIAIDVDVHVGVLFEDVGGLVEDRGIARTNLRLVEVEMYSTQHELLMLWRRRRWGWRRRWRRWWWRWRRWWNYRIADVVTGHASNQRAEDSATGAEISLRIVVGLVAAAASMIVRGDGSGGACACTQACTNYRASIPSARL